MLNRIWRTLASVVFLVGILFSTNAISSERIRIAMVFPITGSSSYFGTVIRNGVELAITKFKNDLKDKNIKVETQLWDDESNPGSIKTIFSEINNWEADIVIGPVESSSTAIGAQQSEDLKIPVITPSATASYLTKLRTPKFFFRAITSDGPRSEDLANWMKELYKGAFLVVYEGRTDTEIKQNMPMLYGESVGIDVCRSLDKDSTAYKAMTFTRSATTDQFCQKFVEEVETKKYSAIAVLGRSVDTQTISLAVRKYDRFFPLFLLSPGKDSFKSNRLFWNKTYAVTDSVIESTQNQRLLKFEALYRTRFDGKSDPIGQYATFGYDAGMIVADSALRAFNRGWPKTTLERRELLRDELGKTPNERQGLISSGGFTSLNELNFVSHRQVLENGNWHEEGPSIIAAASDGASTNATNPATSLSGEKAIGGETNNPNGKPEMSLQLIALMIGVMFLLLVLFIWQMPRLHHFNSRAVTFTILVFVALIAALVMFGSVRSFAHVSGEKVGVAFEFGGPAALFVSVLGIGLWAELGAKSSGGPFRVSILLVNSLGRVVFVDGYFSIFLPSGTVRYRIDKGRAVLSNIPRENAQLTVRILLELDDATLTTDRLDVQLTPDSDHSIEMQNL